MAALGLIVFQAILLFWSLITAESQVVKFPWCQSKCRGMDIPYPFGMEEGCYLDESFKILCNSSMRGPTLTINGTYLGVSYISVRRSTIEVKFPVVSANCVGKDRNTVVDLEGSPFVFSSENYFIARGCGNLALMTQNQSIIGGCMSICDKHSRTTASCSGINCCQTRIPSFLKVFNVSMKGIGDGKGSSGEKQCSSAYLTSLSRIPVDLYYYDYYDELWNFDSNDTREGNYVPVDLDWGIDKRVFESLVKNGSFYNSSYTSMCKIVNPSISPTSQSSTVRCSCSPGFEGNPYLSGICTEEDGTYTSNIITGVKSKLKWQA